MRCETRLLLLVFFFNDTATTEIYTLSLHDALPICLSVYGIMREVHVYPTQNTGKQELSVERIRIPDCGEQLTRC